jgi:hypothetical protein
VAALRMLLVLGHGCRAQTGSDRPIYRVTEVEAPLHGLSVEQTLEARARRRRRARSPPRTRLAWAAARLVDPQAGCLAGGTLLVDGSQDCYPLKDEPR